MTRWIIEHGKLISGIHWIFRHLNRRSDHSTEHIVTYGQKRGAGYSFVHL
jgi:hypothetical protein